MRARIIKIGNSQGIRIPKPLLEQTGILEDVELKVEKDRILISPVANPRECWDDAFRRMGANGDDGLLIDSQAFSHSWDEEEWQW
ncbi:MAG: AbrB/MazE/SpoVT family DNA-binding domain-containing protein [Deltaproteobacteria bacterium]|nr:AbrB/MazE/SpoVT family DNA-binding domain-containing protein [Deltaproteobacteria bacterium]